MELILCSHLKYNLKIYNLNTNQIVNFIENKEIIWCFDFSYDGRILIYGDNRGYHHIFNVTENKLISKNIFYNSYIISIACTKNVDKIILGYADGTTILYNSYTKTFIKKNSHKNTVQSINICEEKNIFITSSYNCIINIWNLDNFNLINSIKQTSETWIYKIVIYKSKYII